jgi:predicted metal-dependent hydrolase
MGRAAKMETRERERMTSKEVYEIARGALDQHGKKDWSIGFHATKKNIGLCQYDRKRIMFSSYWLTKLTVVEWNNVILHEVAHALTGPFHGHNKTWRDKAHEIGLNVAEEIWGCGELQTMRDLLG